MVWTQKNKLSECKRSKAVQFKILHRLNRHNIYNIKLSQLTPRFTLNVRPWNCMLGLDLELDSLSLILGLMPCRWITNKHTQIFDFFPIAARKTTFIVLDQGISLSSIKLRQIIPMKLFPWHEFYNHQPISQPW